MEKSDFIDRRIARFLSKKKKASTLKVAHTLSTTTTTNWFQQQKGRWWAAFLALCAVDDFDVVLVALVTRQHDSHLKLTLDDEGDGDGDGDGDGLTFLTSML